MKEALTIRIPGEIKNELLIISKEENRPVSELVRDSLKKFIAINHFRKLRNETLPFAEAQGILTDEDIFKKIS